MVIFIKGIARLIYVLCARCINRGNQACFLLKLKNDRMFKTHLRVNNREATVGIIVGFIIMMVLDNMFG